MLQLFAGTFFCGFCIQNILLVLNLCFVLGTVKFKDIHCSLTHKQIFTQTNICGLGANHRNCKH